MKSIYTENFDQLIALISHLGATNKASRTPTFIAKDLGLEKGGVLGVLDSFPAFFRRSIKTSERDSSRGDHFYTLHLRYSRRSSDSEEEGASQPLSTDEINMLLGLVTHMVEQEQENSRVIQEIVHSYNNLEATNKITMAAAVVAAFGAVVAAILSGK